MSQLPKGWAVAAIAEIADINPRHPRELEDSLSITFVRMPALSEVSSQFDSTEERSLGEVRKGFTHFAEGDVLFAKITPCMENGKAAVAANLINGLGCGTTELHVMRPLGGIDPKYLFHFVHREAFREEAARNFTGTAGQLRVPVSFVRDAAIPLPPLNEQRRIVMKLEKLLSRVDAAQERLATIPRILKRFRQSVLNAASSGRLTADWRVTITKVEPAAKFLQRIQVDRRSLWEKVELRKKGVKSAENNWQKKYKEPMLTEETEPNGLPQFWKWERLDSALAYIEAGKSFKCVERPPLSGEVGVLKVSAVSWGEFDEHESKTCINKNLINPDIQVRVGDFLFSRANTIELVGACVLVNKVSSKVMLSDKTLRLHIAGLLPGYVLYTLRSSSGRAEIERLATGNQNSMRNIGQERIREILIPVPPLAEQQEIVRRVEAIFKTADALEARYYKAKEHVDKLTQSILAKAFRGDLVPQDPNDEPASVALEHIRADRQNRR